MIGHRVLADAEVVGDFLLPLARRQTREDIGLAAAQRGPQALWRRPGDFLEIGIGEMHHRREVDPVAVIERRGHVVGEILRQDAAVGGAGIAHHREAGHVFAGRVIDGDGDGLHGRPVALARSLDKLPEVVRVRIRPIAGGLAEGECGDRDAAGISRVRGTERLRGQRGRRLLLLLCIAVEDMDLAGHGHPADRIERGGPDRIRAFGMVKRRQEILEEIPQPAHGRAPDIHMESALPNSPSFQRQCRMPFEDIMGCLNNARAWVIKCALRRLVNTSPSRSAVESIGAAQDTRGRPKPLI